MTIRDPDGDGKGPVAGFVLDGTTAESQLLIEVLPGSTGNRHVNSASIKRDRIGRITASQSSLIHSGMRINGRIDSLTYRNVFAAVTADAIGSATVLGNVSDSVWSILGSSSGRLGSLAVNGTFSRSLVSASRISSVKLNAVAQAPAVVEARLSIASVSVARPAFSAAIMTPASPVRGVGGRIAAAEKRAGRRTLECVARALVEGSIHVLETEALLKPILEGDDDGDLTLKDRLTDAELREFLADVKRKPDDIGTPDEPFAVNVADKVDEAIDRAMQPPEQDLPEPRERH